MAIFDMKDVREFTTKYRRVDMLIFLIMAIYLYFS